MSNPQPFETVLKDWGKVFMRRSMQAFARWMNDSGLSRSQVGALMRLYNQGRCPVSSIGDELGITTPAASQLVERLVQLELLERSEDPDDRRVKVVTLSQKGRDLLQQGIEAHLGWMDQIASGLPEAEQTLILKALTTLTEAASQIEEDNEVVDPIPEHGMKL